MLYYIIPLFVCLIAIFRYDMAQTRQREGKLVWIFLYVYLIVLMGYRYEVGGDTLNYMGYWNYQEDLSDWQLTFKEQFAPGYSLLCALSYTLSPEFYVFQLIHSFILNSLLFYFICKNAQYKFSSLMVVFILTYLYFSTEILREVIAVLIFSFNCSNLKNRKWIPYYCGVFLSVLFHYSAFILVIFPFLTWVKFDKKYIWCCLITGVLLMFLLPIISLFEGVVVVGDKLSGYSQDTTHGILADFMALLRSWIFPLLFVLFLKYGMHRSIKYENLIAIMTLFGFAAYFSPIIFSRFSNYLILFYAISLADILIDCIRGSTVTRNNAIILFFCFILLYGSDYIMYRRYMMWVPYYSIWNPHHADRDNYNKN